MKSGEWGGEMNDQNLFEMVKQHLCSCSTEQTILNIKVAGNGHEKICSPRSEKIPSTGVHGIVLPISMPMRGGWKNISKRGKKMWRSGRITHGLFGDLL